MLKILSKHKIANAQKRSNIRKPSFVKELWNIILNIEQVKVVTGFYDSVWLAWLIDPSIKLKLHAQELARVKD